MPSRTMTRLLAATLTCCIVLSGCAYSPFVSTKKINPMGEAQLANKTSQQLTMQDSAKFAWLMREKYDAMIVDDVHRQRAVEAALIATVGTILGLAFGDGNQKAIGILSVSGAGVYAAETRFNNAKNRYIYSNARQAIDCLLEEANTYTEYHAGSSKTTSLSSFTTRIDEIQNTRNAVHTSVYNISKTPPLEIIENLHYIDVKILQMRNIIRENENTEKKLATKMLLKILQINSQVNVEVSKNEPDFANFHNFLADSFKSFTGSVTGIGDISPPSTLAAEIKVHDPKAQKGGSPQGLQDLQSDDYAELKKEIESLKAQVNTTYKQIEMISKSTTNANTAFSECSKLNITSKTETTIFPNKIDKFTGGKASIYINAKFPPLTYSSDIPMDQTKNQWIYGGASNQDILEINCASVDPKNRKAGTIKIIDASNNTLSATVDFTKCN